MSRAIPQSLNYTTTWYSNQRAFGASVGLFFAANVFINSGIRFDERIGVGTELPAAEEFDVLLTALSYGHQARYEPQIVVYHTVEERLTKNIVRAEEVARSYVLGKHFRRHNVLFDMRVIGRWFRVAAQAIIDDVAKVRLGAIIAGYRMAGGRFRGSEGHRMNSKGNTRFLP